MCACTRPGYATQPGQRPTPAIGSIPQVEHTYGYLDGDYGQCTFTFGNTLLFYSTFSHVFGKYPFISHFLSSGFDRHK